jgi:hypothetical protein
VSKVTDMREMFRSSALFDQNLCAWGEKIRAIATDMFLRPDSPSQLDPILASLPYENLCQGLCCNPGFSDVSGICVYLNECSDETDNCSANAECSN